MKTLYLGLYDYPYYGQVYILNNGKFEKYELSDDEIDMLYYFYLYNANLNLWNNYCPYSRDEINECLDKLSVIFSDIVVCSDGTFEYFKLK
jgi:hypothetical protein